MKKITLALLAALSGTAYAQSSVVVYGIVDAGLLSEKGGAQSTGLKIANGVASASRIGFRGTESLGDGMSANFVLETGYKVDTGEVDAAGSIFNRQAYISLNSQAGNISLGRQYTPMYIALSTVGDPFAAGLSGSAKNLFAASGSLVRASNTVQVQTPKVNGFTGTAAVSLAEQASGGTLTGRQYGLSLAYAREDLNVSLAYNNRDTSVATGTGIVPAIMSRNLLLAANHTIAQNGIKLFGVIARNKGAGSSPLPNTGTPFGGVKPTASTDSQDLLVGATMPMGAGTLIGSVIYKNDRSSFDQDAKQYAIGYIHKLSTRTNIYTSVAQIKNSKGAGYTVGTNADVGTGNKAFNVGVRHSF